jgi:four helix bundle protein
VPAKKGEDEVKDFKELKVWSKAHAVTLAVYQLARQFPKEELYGLTSQIRRSAASVGANIAEGCGRRSDGELCRFLQIAYGSAAELEYHLLLARDLHILESAKFQIMERQVDEVQRMLTSLIQSVRPASKVKLEPRREPARAIGSSSQLVAPSSKLVCP